MNTARIIVIALVGLLIGVLIGFGFRGSLADVLNLNAAGVSESSGSSSVFKALGVLPNKTAGAPEFIIPGIVPTYSDSSFKKLTDVMVYNLADLPKADWETCLATVKPGQQACFIEKIKANSLPSIYPNKGKVGDTTRPVVSVTAPADNATVSGTVTLTATATHEVGISEVSFSLEDGTILAKVKASPYTYSWDTLLVANGTYTIYVRAGSNSGSTDFKKIKVTVKNPVEVSITAPVANAIVAGSVAVTVTVTANVGVKKVELYVDNVLTKTSTKSPFSMTWDANKATSGSHALMVKAYDGAGNVGTSAAVTVTK